MSEESAIALFVGEVARHVRALPFHEAVQFLRGGLLLIGDRAEAQPLREVSIVLTSAENQLELIARSPLERSAA